MSAELFLGYLTQLLFLLIFLSVLRITIRHPSRARIDTTLFFGAAVVIVLLGFVERAVSVSLRPILVAVSQSVVLALPYLFLRLVADASAVPIWLMRAAVMGLILQIIAFFMLLGQPLPLWLVGFAVVYFVLILIYGAAVVIREAYESRGVTRRRMQAVAAGSLLLGVVILSAGLQMVLPGVTAFVVIGELASLGAAVSYYLGFAPPTWLRRAWQEPELRLFLEQVGTLSRLHSRDVIIQELENGAAQTLGAPIAVIGIWDPHAGVLRARWDGQEIERHPGQGLMGKVFVTQQPTFSTDVRREYPQLAEFYQRYGTHAALAAPMTLGSYKLGVLAVYDRRSSLFVEDDLALAQVLATQSALILEIRNLIDETAGLVAQQESLRFKEDFISAAAHELKTPLTVVLGQAQLLARQASLHPESPVDQNRVKQLVEEAKRLSGLISEILDTTRKEPRGITTSREPIDLAQIASEVCHEEAAPRHQCVVESPQPVIGMYDPVTIRELFEHLIENAIGYSPAGGEVRIRIWVEGTEAYIAVTDQGIGIPEADLTHLFERFYRGANVDARRFPGMGLGLYIAHRIVTEYHGRIWATSPGPGRGSTFHVVLPLAPAAKVAPAHETSA